MMIAYREYEESGRNNSRVHGLINAVFMVAIGLQLLRSETTFLTSGIYEVMAKVAREEVWGVILFVIGTMRCLVVLFGIKHPLNSRAMTASFILTFISMGLWLAMAAAFFVANPLGLSCLAYIAFTAHDASNYFLVSKMTGVTRGRERYGASQP